METQIVLSLAFVLETLTERGILKTIILRSLDILRRVLEHFLKELRQKLKISEKIKRILDERE